MSITVTKTEEGFLEVEVSDNGCGISDEDQQKLFKLFGFLEASKELNTEGCGLGLHISLKTCKQFGGDMWVRSELGKGSTFGFKIKLEES